MNKNILPSFKSESSMCIKLLSLKRKSRLWIESQAISCWLQDETLAYSPSTCWFFSAGLNENANAFFATTCCLWSAKIAVSPGNAVHKAALRSQTLLYQALQAWWNKNETNRTNHQSQWKCFLNLHACQPVVGDSQNQNMNILLPIIGAF